MAAAVVILAAVLAISWAPSIPRADLGRADILSDGPLTIPSVTHRPVASESLHLTGSPRPSPSNVSEAGVILSSSAGAYCCTIPFTAGGVSYDPNAGTVDQFGYVLDWHGTVPEVVPSVLPTDAANGTPTRTYQFPSFQNWTMTTLTFDAETGLGYATLYNQTGWTEAGRGVESNSSSYVIVFNASSGALLGSVNLTNETYDKVAYSATIAETQQVLYVASVNATNLEGGVISRVDTETNTYAGTVSIPPNFDPVAVALNANDSTLFVAARNTSAALNNSPGSLVLLSIGTSTFSVSSSAVVSIWGANEWPTGLSYDPWDGAVYMVSSGEGPLNTVTGFTPVWANVSVFGGATGGYLGTTLLGNYTGLGLYNSTIVPGEPGFDPDNHDLYVALAMESISGGEWIYGYSSGYTLAVLDGTSIGALGQPVEFLRVPVGGVAVPTPAFVPLGTGEMWELSCVALCVIGLPPSVSDLTASPNPDDEFHLVGLSASSIEGAGQLIFNYSGLPAGCETGPRFTADLKCTPEVNGTFLVRLNVSDQLGVYAESNLTLTIDSLLSVGVPTAYVLADQGAPAVLAVIPSGGAPPYVVRWNFGDGTTSASTPVDHSYARVGTFAAWATVTDLGGGNVSALVHVNVSLPMNGLAVSDNRTEVDVEIPVQFEISVSDGSPPYRVDWNFGDGTTGNNSTSVHTFATAGVFDVTATVIDSANQSQTASTTIAVSELPTLTLRTPAGSSLIAGSAGAFSTLLSGGTGPFQVVWRFGDGLSASGQNVRPHLR